MRFLLPLIGGIMMTIVFVLSCVFMLDPDYGETTIWGVSGALVMGVGALALGVVVMYIGSTFAGAGEYFAGEAVNEDTPLLVPQPYCRDTDDHRDRTPDTHDPHYRR